MNVSTKLFVGMGLLALLVCGSAGAATIQVSGGGTNVISGAVAGASGGDVIEIADSAVYTENNVNWTIGVWNITIMATAGQTPTINFEQASEQAIIPNVGGFQLGSNAGGRITVNGKSGIELFNGFWMTDGMACTLENLEMNEDGVSGSLFFMAENAENITMNVNNCVFTNWTKAAIRTGQDGTGVLTVNITDCVFDYVQEGVSFGGSNGTVATVTDCLFQDWYTFAINCIFGAGSTLDVSGCAFYISSGRGYAGEVGVFTGAATGGDVTVDHCDFLSDDASAFLAGAVQSVWAGAANVDVTNCNIMLAGPSLNDATTSSPTLTYDYCSMNGAASGLWTGGAHNLDPATKDRGIPTRR